MKWKSLAVIVAGAVLVSVLAACGSDATPTPTQAAAAQPAAPVPTQVVSQAPAVVAPVAPAETTAPAETAMVKEKPVLGGIWDYERGTPDFHDPYGLRAGFNNLNFANGLIQVRFPVDRNKGIEFEPYLGTEWTISADQTKWRFKLREGVTWHDGEVFNADDVVATTRRMLDNEFLTGSILVTMRSVLAGVEKIDDYTVEFDTGKPDATAFTYFASHYFTMTPAHLITGPNPASSDVEERWKLMGPNVNLNQTGTWYVGTGPWKVKDWKLDTTLIGEKNENYFKFDEDGVRLPYMQTLRYHDIPDGLRRLATFVSGNTEYSQGAGAGMTIRDASALCKQTKEAGCKLYKWEHGFGTISNNTAQPIFQDPNVNAASRYGHDVERPLNAAFAGGSPWLWVERELYPDSTLSVKEQYEVIPWSDPTRRAEFNAKAKELMADAGHVDGAKLPFPFFAGGGSGGNPLCYGSFLDQYSRHMDEIYNIGFKTILECRAGVSYDEELLNGRWSIWGYYPATSLIDPGTGIIQAAVNNSRIMIYLKNGGWVWDDLDTVDSKYRVIQATLDKAKQNELFKDFERYMAEPSQPHWMTYYARVYMSIRGCVHNYQPGGIWHTHQFALERAWVTGDCRN